MTMAILEKQTYCKTMTTNRYRVVHYALK